MPAFNWTHSRSKANAVPSHPSHRRPTPPQGPPTNRTRRSFDIAVLSSKRLIGGEGVRSGGTKPNEPSGSKFTSHTTPCVSPRVAPAEPRAIPSAEYPSSSRATNPTSASHAHSPPIWMLGGAASPSRGEEAQPPTPWRHTMPHHDPISPLSSFYSYAPCTRATYEKSGPSPTLSQLEVEEEKQRSFPIRLLQPRSPRSAHLIDCGYEEDEPFRLDSPLRLQPPDTPFHLPLSYKTSPTPGFPANSGYSEIADDGPNTLESDFSLSSPVQRLMPTFTGTSPAAHQHPTFAGISTVANLPPTFTAALPAEQLLPTFNGAATALPSFVGTSPAARLHSTFTGNSPVTQLLPTFIGTITSPADQPLPTFNDTSPSDAPLLSTFAATSPAAHLHPTCAASSPATQPFKSFTATSPEHLLCAEERLLCDETLSGHGIAEEHDPPSLPMHSLLPELSASLPSFCADEFSKLHDDDPPASLTELFEPPPSRGQWAPEQQSEPQPVVTASSPTVAKGVGCRESAGQSSPPSASTSDGSTDARADLQENESHPRCFRTEGGSEAEKMVSLEYGSFIHTSPSNETWSHPSGKPAVRHTVTQTVAHCQSTAHRAVQATTRRSSCGTQTSPPRGCVAKLLLRAKRRSVTMSQVLMRQALVRAVERKLSVSSG